MSGIGEGPIRGVWTDSAGVTWARFDVSADISQAKQSDRQQLASDLRSHLIESAQRFVDGWLAITRGDTPEEVQAAIHGRRADQVEEHRSPDKMNGHHHPKLKAED